MCFAWQQYHLNQLRGIDDLLRLWKELGSLGSIKLNLLSRLHFFPADQVNAYYAYITRATAALIFDEFLRMLSSIRCVFFISRSHD